MISVVELKVRTYDVDHLDVFWTLENTDEALERYDLYLLRSVDGPGGPFREIAGPFANKFNFRDPDVHLLHKWRTYFYRLRMVERETGLEEVTGPVRLEAEPDRISLEIQRRQELLLREFNGRKALLFPALTFGQRCRHCWDIGPRGNSIKRSRQQQCVSCYDSTFVGGFASPLLIYIQFDTSPVSVQRTDVGERASIDSTARLGAWPPVNPKDVVVEQGNKRWEVQKVTPLQKLRATTHQEIVVHAIPVPDVRFKLPVLLDLLLQHSPEREFSRSMSPQNPPIQPLPDLLGPL